jgi:hypothetical protein
MAVNITTEFYEDIFTAPQIQISVMVTAKNSVYALRKFSTESLLVDIMDRRTLPGLGLIFC